jgi:hypothetical protein
MSLCHCCVERKTGTIHRVKYWELIADKLSKAGLSWGCSPQIDATTGQVLYTADAYRNDGQRFVVHADEKLTAFLELERAICLRLLTDQILEK